jgi:hypothetical protein
VNQANQVQLAGHGRELPADGLRGEKESHIHDEDLNMNSRVACLLPEVFTFQKTGSFQFSLCADSVTMRDR